MNSAALKQTNQQKALWIAGLPVYIEKFSELWNRLFLARIPLNVIEDVRVNYNSAQELIAFEVLCCSCCYTLGK